MKYEQQLKEALKSLEKYANLDCVFSKPEPLDLEMLDDEETYIYAASIILKLVALSNDKKFFNNLQREILPKECFNYSQFLFNYFNSNFTISKTDQGFTVTQQFITNSKPLVYQMYNFIYLELRDIFYNDKIKHIKGNIRHYEKQIEEQKKFLHSLEIEYKSL